MKKYILHILLLFLFIACTKDEEENVPEPEVQHESVVINTNNWETVAVSDFIMSGRMGYSFESDINYELGGVENGSPIFLGKHSYYRSAGPEGPYSEIHVVSGNELLHYSLPFLLLNETRSTVPQNILDEFGNNSIGNPAISRVYNRLFRSSGRLWAKGELEINGSRITDDGTLIKNDKETFGWMNYVNYNNFPGGYVAQGTTPEVWFANIGELDVVENNGKRSIYFMATFNNNIGGSGNQRALMCRKDRDSQKIEIDAVSVLPNSVNITSDNYPDFKTVVFSKSEIFGIYIDHINKEIEVYRGNMSGGFQLLQTIPNSTFENLVKGRNEFFIISSDLNSGNQTKSIKFSKDGAFTDLGAIEQGKYSYFNGNLVVGTDNNLNEIQILEVTGLGTPNILAAVGDIDVGQAEGVIYRGDELMDFASDGKNLFVALKNWKSPKYRGEGGQFGGVEIIKYKN